MRACECRVRPGESVPRVAKYDRPKGGYTLAYLATERHSTKPVGMPHYPHSVLITSVSQPGTGRLDGSKDYPCHCRHRPSSRLRRRMPPRKPSLNGGRPAIPSVPSFPGDFGSSSCPCSTQPPMPFPSTGTVLSSGIAACGSPCFLRRRQPPSPTGRRTGRSCLSPCVVIGRCPAQPSDGFHCKVYADGTEIFRFLESMLFLVPCCRSHHSIPVCERSAGLWMPLFIFILQQKFSLSFRCRSGTPLVFVIMLTTLCFSSSRHLWVCLAASASARPLWPWCPMLYASARRSHGTTGRC